MLRTAMLVFTALMLACEGEATGGSSRDGEDSSDVYIDPGFRDVNTGDGVDPDGAPLDGVGPADAPDGVDGVDGTDTPDTTQTPDTPDTGVLADTDEPSEVLPDTTPDTTTPPDVAPFGCALPWGGELAHGGEVLAYAVASAPCGSTCAAETRRCDNGRLSGSGLWPSCQVAACASCPLPWGGALPHGQSTLAWTSSSVPCGGTCTSQTRICDNGTLSGSATAASCTPAPCQPAIIFSTSYTGPAMSSFKSNQLFYGRLLNLDPNLTESCAEPLGRAAPNCRNGAAWTRLPNNDWTWDIATSEWRAVFLPNTFPPVTVEVFVRHLGNGLSASMVLELRNPCQWTAVVAGPVSPPATPCAPANQGATTQHSGYTWTCECN